MAFEAFRTASKPRLSRRRRLTYAVSFAVHLLAISSGVAYSFWHIEELSPPTVRVTFMSATPPPPPPPPPPSAGGGGPAKRKLVAKPHPIVPTKTPEIVQPREPQQKEPPKESPPQSDDHPAGEKGGVIGGTIGGTVGGTIGGTIGGKVGGVIGGSVGGTGAAPVAPKLLPPNMGAGQKESGGDPPFPASLCRSGAIHRVLAKICVSPGGSVERVTIVKGADPLLDEGVVSTVKGWRYRPLLANSTPVPFCYPAMFEFKCK